MQLARFLNNTFKNDGFILIDANSKKYIIGFPQKKKTNYSENFRKETSL